jgi:DGQHR domain-containing protein
MVTANQFEAPKFIPVVQGPKLHKADVATIAGFMPAGALIPYAYVIPHHDPRTKKGYQRLPQDARINELVYDLRRNRVDLPTAILLNVRGREAHQAFRDGRLDMRRFTPARPNVPPEDNFFVVDGQHRVLALEKLIGEFDENYWSAFQIPFVCMLGANEDQEMEQFYNVNSKAKSVRTDLAYELLRQRAIVDPEVMDALTERGQDWIVRAQSLVQKLSEDSPVWRSRIRFAAMEKGQTIMPSASMVSSLKPLLSSPYFKVVAPDQQVKIVDAFWRGLRDIMQDAFDNPSDYALQKGVGVIVMHTVLVPLLEIIRAKGLSVVEPESYRAILAEPLSLLQGDDASGHPIKGLDFWRVSPHGAAGSYSSSAGRRVLIAKIQMLLPNAEIH